MTTLLIIVVILFVIIAVALAALKAKGGAEIEGGKSDVYYLKKSLFSPAERSFYGVLESINYEGVSIASKVRLADIFGIKKGLERGDRQRALNRISSKHIDFLFIQKGDGKAILGIELNDSSHEEEDRIVRDTFVDTVFASASLPILHISVRQAYDRNALRQSIDTAINQYEKKNGGEQ